ncbi:low molecular weight phosphotyrosine protein phosphatase-like [Glandiceps talaboti]
MATPSSTETSSGVDNSAAKIHSALFVCFGNYCRSPIAEAVFATLLKDRGLSNDWLVDSAGLSDWHVGKLPDERGRAALKLHNIVTNHIGRQITRRDFAKFEYIFGMDDSNFSMLNDMKPKNSKAIVKLLGSYDPQGSEIIDDCYYGEVADFENVLLKCKRSCKVFLDEVKRQDSS